MATQVLVLGLHTALEQFSTANSTCISVYNHADPQLLINGGSSPSWEVRTIGAKQVGMRMKERGKETSHGFQG